MASRYPLFDRSRLRCLPLAERTHDLDLRCLLPLAPVAEPAPVFREIGARILTARGQGAAVVLLMGAHVLRAGVQRYLIDLLERGLLSCIAVNGAAVIHDYELALVGATTESVARYIAEGQFGLWQETGRLNDIVREAAERGEGIGEAVGRHIAVTAPPHADISLLAAAWRCGVPLTVHVGIGYDIVHEHPSCDGGAWGAASYTDFLIFARCLASLTGGVVMNFGSAVMAPEVFLKALAMARNVAQQEGRHIEGFSTLVCDLRELPADYRREAPRDDPAYYFRPWKTMLVRTLRDGASHYVRGHHRETVPALWTAITENRKQEKQQWPKIRQVLATLMFSILTPVASLAFCFPCSGIAIRPRWMRNTMRRSSRAASCNGALGRPCAGCSASTEQSCWRIFCKPGDTRRWRPGN